MARGKVRSSGPAKAGRRKRTSGISPTTSKRVKESSAERMRKESAVAPRRAGIIETIRHGHTTIDREGRYIDVSEQVARAIGKTRGELLGRSLWEIFPDAGSAFRSQCEEAWREHRPVSFEHFSAELGRWYEIFLYPFANGLSIQGQDISERKLAEQALRESELRLRTVLENTPEGYAIYDADRRFEYLNSVGLKLANCRLEDVIGKRDEELWPEEVTRSYVPHLVRAYETGLPQKFELDTTAVSGDVFTKLVTVVPLKDSDGNVRQAIMATYDMTERKRFERALLEADRRKNEFLAVLSHELRNPLTPIRYSLFVLDHATPGSEQARSAKAIIDRQIDHLARIVDDLLDVTRISRGKIKLKRTVFDLGALVQRTAEAYESLFTASGVALETDVTNRRLVMDGDATRIAQIVGNLLQNAAKFTPKGGRVSLTLQGDPTRKMAVIGVRDTGVGIKPEELPRLFQPFEQAADSLDRSSGGLGLGLALVKALAQMHGGKVEARSRGLGTGAEFMVSLPLHPGRAVDDASPAEPDHLPSRRVLIIEDRPDSARGLGEILKLAKHDVAIAHSGAEGLEQARRFKPDIVFCDIGLPGMDGYQLARAIRSDDQLRSTYLVALTGYALPSDRAKARAAGFDEHLAKPPGIAQLGKVLARAPSRR
jgi:PAS domain S-box-containing protein